MSAIARTQSESKRLRAKQIAIAGVAVTLTFAALLLLSRVFLANGSGEFVISPNDKVEFDVESTLVGERVIARVTSPSGELYVFLHDNRQPGKFDLYINNRELLIVDDYKDPFEHTKTLIFLDGNLWTQEPKRVDVWMKANMHSAKYVGRYLYNP